MIADSTAAVVIANGIRDRLDRLVGGGDYQLIARLDMNKELERSGYNPDAILTTTTSRTLAGQLNAKILVGGTLAKNASGQYVLTVRVTGVSGSIADVGHGISVTQAPGQALPDFGLKTAEALNPIVKAYIDAKNCIDNQSDPKKGPDAAAKAIKAVPNFGLAEYCLAQIAQRTDSVSPVALAHYQNAVKGDSLSLTVWSEIALIHYKKKDSVAVIADYQQMLRVAPSNEKLADEAYKQFLRYGRPDAAQQVVTEALKNDPANPVWYDLWSNNCLAKSDFDCAIKALEQVFTLDSTRADLGFFQKIVAAAKFKPDTAKYLAWSRRGAAKFGTDVDMLGDYAKAAAMSGEGDSAVAAVHHLLLIDPTATTPALFVVQSLMNAKKFDAMLKLAPDFKKVSDQEAKDTYAGLLMSAANGAQSAVPRDDSMLVKLSEATLASGTTQQNLIVYANFFLLEANVGPLQPLSAQWGAEKSCDKVKAEDALITKLEPWATVAATSTVQGIIDYANNLLKILPGVKTRVAAGITAYCH